MTSVERSALVSERAAGRGWGTVRPERFEPLRALDLGTVLDVGCSAGDYVRALRDLGTDAVGVDLLADPAWHQPGAVPFGVGEATRIPVADKAVDTVISFETMEHVPDPSAMLAEIRRVARRRLVLSVPNAEPLPWGRSAGLTQHHHADRTHVNFYDETSLRREVEDAGFDVESLVPILPVHPFVPALDALGLSDRWAQGLGRRLSVLARRRHHTSLLVVARVR